MSEILLIDTDVIIDYLRNQVDAVAYIESLTNPLLISVITVAELYSGVQATYSVKIPLVVVTCSRALTSDIRILQLQW